MVITLPNFLTLMRILAVPCFAIALWYGYGVQACIIFGVAAITDLLDGFIARRFNQISELGAILDPAADKLLMTTAFLILAFNNEAFQVKIPAWVAILAVSRDVLIALTALLAFDSLGKDRFRPSIIGKATTAFELFAISIALLANAHPVFHSLTRVAQILFYVMAFLVISSGLHYFFRATQPRVQE